MGTHGLRQGCQYQSMVHLLKQRFCHWYKSQGHRCLKSGTGPKLPSDAICEQEEGYYGAGNNVRGHAALRSAGPDDCAAKCSRVAGCNGWTLHKRSNYCWLKTTRSSKGSSRDWLRGKPCASKHAGALKECECNGHKANGTGYGECNKEDADCGRWCYVDNDAPCLETNPSLNGEPYRWTCEACSAATIQRGIGLLLFGILVLLF